MKYTYQTHLPIFEKKDEILQSIRNNQVTIISGETGSGKTTQLPLLCLEAGLGASGLIGCTQPRRIAAISLSDHVASCFDDPKSVGYKIRFREQLYPETKIKFMTDGVLLSEISHDSMLHKYDAIIIDEAHERSVNIDFLLGYMRTLLPKRPDLRLIISSATIDTKLFSRCFHHAPVITVTGRLFPVETRYKPVIELWKGQSMDCYIEGVLTSVRELLQDDKKGDILIFLPTIEDILETVNRLSSVCSEDITIYPLHSRMSASSQQQIFHHVNGRKIVVATNIAETSITVPGIRYVIDSGLARMLTYEPTVGFNRMPIERISRASAEQRAGRCGRISEGICIRLYSEQDYLSRPGFTTPEIRRTNLAGVILKMLSLGLGDASKFPFPQQSSHKAFSDGYRQLQELGATDRKNRLTGLGKRMARLPLDPPISRMLMYAFDNGALAEVLIIAAALSVDDPWGYREERPNRFRHRESDFMGYISLWTAFHGSLSRKHFSRSALNKFCEQNNLLPLRMREWFDAQKQLEMICHSISGSKKSKNNHPSYDNIHKSLLAGLLHGIAYRVESGLYHGLQSGEICPFPSSVLFGKDSSWVLFHQIVETTRVYGRMAAKIKPQWIEELFKTQCSYSWHDPWFDVKTGLVMAREEVTFHGLKLVRNRIVELSKKDPSLANEIFIRDALVKEFAGDRFRFIRVNRELRQTISLSERKLRTTLYAGDMILQALYEEKLAGITSIDELFGKIKMMNGDSFLIFRPEELMLNSSNSDTSRYPDQIEVCDRTCKLSYCFAPNKEDDGLSVYVAEELFRIVPLYYWEWLIPVFVRDRIRLCIDMLSKRFPESTIDKITALENLSIELTTCSGPFSEALSSAIKLCLGISIEPDEICSNVPVHLWPRIIVQNGKGITVHGYRAAVDIKSRSDSFNNIRPVQWYSICENLEMEFIDQWENTQFLKPVSIGSSRQIIPLSGFTALHSERNSLWVRVFFSYDAAVKSHSNCIRQMAEQKIAESLAWELESFKLPDILIRKLNKILDITTSDDLAERVFLNSILKLPHDTPCDRQSFINYLQVSQLRISNAKAEVICSFEKILLELDNCYKLFTKRSARHGIVTSAAIREELWQAIEDYRLMLISKTLPMELFEFIPRSLQGLIRRIDMGFLEPRKYKERTETIRQFSDKLHRHFLENKWTTEADNWKMRFIMEYFIKQQFTSPNPKSASDFQIQILDLKSENPGLGKSESEILHQTYDKY